MRGMSCGRAERLMPLYAAGDLPAGRRNRAVAAHVASCGTCASLAEEFRASIEWARAGGAAPEFGEEFYEQLRAGVLSQINRDSRPAAPRRFAPLFRAPFAGRRLAYAALLALAACCLALALHFGRGAGEPQKGEVAVAPPPGELVSPPARGIQAPPRTPDAKTKERKSHGKLNDDERLTRPKGDTAGGSFKRTPTLRRAATTADAARAPELTAAASDPRPRGGTPSAPLGVAPSTPPARETAIASRIEIQTADPNIRIIWLAPGDGSEAEPDRVEPDR